MKKTASTYFARHVTDQETGECGPGKSTIRNDEDLSTIDSVGRMPLHVVVEKKGLGITRKLLECGRDPLDEYPEGRMSLRHFRSGGKTARLVGETERKARRNMEPPAEPDDGHSPGT